MIILIINHVAEKETDAQKTAVLVQNHPVSLAVDLLLDSTATLGLRPLSVGTVSFCLFGQPAH